MSLVSWANSQWQGSLSVSAETDESLRHATWLELFFDLVFVVALAELGALLHDTLDVVGFVRFVALFAIVWWIWLAVSYYADTYATDDLLSRLFVIAAMFLVILLSQTIAGALTGASFAFAASVLALRVLLTLGHLRALYMRSDARQFVEYWVGLEVLVTVVWGLSLLVPPPGRFGLWVASFGLGTAGLAVVYLGFDTIETQVSHFSERLGLFTILVLGETILGVSLATSLVPLDVRTALVGALAFAVPVAVWWLYFNRFDEQAVSWSPPNEADRWLEARQRVIVHIYSHYLVHGGIVATGVGLAVAVEASQAGHALPAGSSSVLYAGLTAVIVGVAISHRTSPASLGRQPVVARFVFAALFTALAAGWHVRSPLATVGAAVCLLCALVAVENASRLVAVPASG
ncbi:low temperature requirement protein A [Haloarcula sp. S1CR25-12]|uniref:Low temperature requirement protein A n=1 Tax=Haloarcula saliterrae TaxID=2950534 RepID=A0ABU2FDW6_9EURY|nr:low temperature requirement protein A [Haloarcula sp. S1CR25-12]MDS0260462.1 low temperature requirement protein A [Haloarcula sp. S1CR25-12]